MNSETPSQKTFDIVIIGGGPAGAAAAVYAARKQLSSVIVTPAFGGQSDVSPEIYNWIGTPAISGVDLAKSFEQHVRDYEGEYLTIVTGEKVIDLIKEEGRAGAFLVKTDKDQIFKTKTVLVVSGSSRRQLAIPGSKEYEHKGVVYCATCDGPLFEGQEVVVVGGGNAGFETAAQLSAYCKHVTLLHRGDQYKADAITVEKVLAKENVTGYLNTEPVKVEGEAFVKNLRAKNKKTEEEFDIPAGGVFVEIGQIPNTQFITDDDLELTPFNQIVVDPRRQRSTTLGVWAAGDVTNGLYHQNNIAAGDAVKAIEDIYMYLQTGK